MFRGREEGEGEMPRLDNDEAQGKVARSGAGGELRRAESVTAITCALEVISPSLPLQVWVTVRPCHSRSLWSRK